jgi:hypothetical protein
MNTTPSGLANNLSLGTRGAHLILDEDAAFIGLRGPAEVEGID